MKMAAGDRVYLIPQGLISGQPAAEAIGAGEALPLTSTGLAFARCEIRRREDGGSVSSRTVAAPDLFEKSSDSDLSAPLARLTGAREPVSLGDATLSFDRPLVMAIVNVTPDSFSGDGLAGDIPAAIACGHRQISEGADLIDVGGESTRPGAAHVDPSEECSRVLPVISALKDQGVPISVDTRRANVMTAAVHAGATIINDVSALCGDPDSLRAAAGSGVSVVLNHMRGTPENMQDHPVYKDVVLDVYDELEVRVDASIAAGICRERLIIDPGFGFGKTVDHNLLLLSNLSLFQGLGCPVLIGASRKSFIGAIASGAVPTDRLPGSLAAALVAVRQGANIVRVHDVAATRQALDVLAAVDQEI